MAETPTPLGERVNAARVSSGVATSEAAATLGVTVEGYAGIEAGQRPLRGDELVILADLFGVRASWIISDIPVRTSVRIDDLTSPLAALRDRLHAYLELDAYLTSQGIVAHPGRSNRGM